MIITTTEERNLVDCCGCDMPQCDAPRKECESISLSFACYFDVYLWTGTDPDIPTGDLCMRYGRIHTSSVVEIHREDSDGYTYDEVEVTEQTIKNLPQEDGCISNRATVVAASYNRLKEIHDISPSQDRVWNDYYSFSETVACDGEESFTDSLNPGSNYSNPLTCYEDFIDYRTLINNNSSWSYSSPGVFTRNYFIDTSSPPMTPVDTYEYTITVSFLDPFDLTHITAKIGELSYPDDVNGEVCSSIISEDINCPGLISSATLARYRFGIPLGYSRSVWEMQWDEVFAPASWWEWLDGGRVGTEPTPGPQLIASKSWTWSGAGEWSDWYEIPLPTEPGETRVVNVMVKCYKSTRLGVKPTTHGESCEIPTP